MWLILALLAVPVIEIGIFIQVGGWIGLWPTLGLVVLSAIAGTMLLRSQGTETMNRLRRSFAEMTDPSEALAHGAMILFAGALLITPGFFTDLIGFALLVPQVRLAVFRWARSRIRLRAFGVEQTVRQAENGNGGTVIDGEFEEVAPPRQATHQPSGWTRH